MFVALETARQLIAALQPLVVGLRTRDPALARQIVNAASSVALNLSLRADAPAAV